MLWFSLQSILDAVTLETAYQKHCEVYRNGTTRADYIRYISVWAAGQDYDAHTAR